MSDRNISSIKDYLLHYSVVIFLVVLLAAVIHYFVYSHQLHNIQQNQQLQSLKYSATSVQRLLGFYQSVVDKIAGQHVVVDLLQFGSDAEIHRWSVDMQRLLPESIGLALFNNDGKVRGYRKELRLSDRCFKDMQRRIAGLDVPWPPVHSRIEQLAHFDIVSPVIVDGESVGLVFASFSLNTIDDLLRSISFQNDAYQVVTSDNYKVASVGPTLDAEHDSYAMPIPGTDWTIKKQTRDTSKGIFVASLLASNIVVFVLVIGVLFVAIKKLFNMVIYDFESLNQMMKKIREGGFNVDDMPRPHLAETAGIIGFIQNAAVELHRHQKKLKLDSTTDELTGLFNRRVLNERIGDFIQRVNAGSEVYVVILDMDHFKEINDSHGHEIGDQVLILFSQALINNCKDTDVCTRAGGDEFIVVLNEYQPQQVNDWYARVCEELQASIAELCAENSIELEYGVSAGCTLVRNNDNKHALMKRADEALYQVKTRGKNDILCV